MEEIDDRLQEILHVHFDTRWGSPFWLRLRSEFSFDPLTDIRNVADLVHFGPTPIELLAKLPVEEFIPRKYHDRLSEFVVAETSGATGPPKRTAYLSDEFRMAFVEPFLAGAAAVKFPKDRHWLYIGPSGPHIIGKAARECAIALGSMDPFTVDFDPRWSQKLPSGSMARNRYLEHVLQQAESVLKSQDIGVLFSTPPVLAALGERLDLTQRESIAGIHLGGVAAEEGFWDALTNEWFPNAVAMGGYGNSLAGMCPQLIADTYFPPTYFPYGERLVLDIDSPNESGRGQVLFHRLDHSCFLPNVLERDEAEGIRIEEHSHLKGFQQFGICDPRPPLRAKTTLKEALY